MRVLPKKTACTTPAHTHTHRTHAPGEQRKLTQHHLTWTCRADEQLHCARHAVVHLVPRPAVPSSTHWLWQPLLWLRCHRRWWCCCRCCCSSSCRCRPWNGRQRLGVTATVTATVRVAVTVMARRVVVGTCSTRKEPMQSIPWAAAGAAPVVAMPKHHASVLHVPQHAWRGSNTPSTRRVTGFTHV